MASIAGEERLVDHISLAHLVDCIKPISLSFVCLLNLLAVHFTIG